MKYTKEEQGNLKAIGQFFYGENFNEPAFVVARGANGFKVEEKSLQDTVLQKKVQSVRWLSNFSPKQSGIYTFTSKSDAFMHILINKSNAKNQEIQLEEGKNYTLLVAYFGNPLVESEELFQLDIQYTFNRQEQKGIDLENFSIPEIVSYEEYANEMFSANLKEERPHLDTDNDGIYDDWELKGYTVIDHVVFPWPDNTNLEGKAKEEEYIKAGRKKYVSNPNESHTAGDPFSDLEKASGAIDRSISKVAWDPMVAAYPSVTVGMERLILSKKTEIGGTIGENVSHTTSSSVSESNTLGVDASVSLSTFGPSLSVTGHYSNTSTHTIDSSDTSGKEWHKSLGLNTGDSANLNANIRYYNTGTAPIYNLLPTTSLVLGKETIATVSAQLNQQALDIPPGQTYPKRHLNGLSLNTLDQFSVAPISINLNQLNRLENGEKLKLETNQFLGKFARRDPVGGQVVMEENDWADYIPQIESVTASILININGNRFIERRIAAKDPENANDKTPEFTIGESLKKLFGATYDGKERNWYFIDEETNKKHILSPDLVHFIVDKKTKQLIEMEIEKLKEETKIVDLYELKVRPGMNIQINLPLISEDFQEPNDKWTGGTFISSQEAAFKGACYKIEPGGTTKYQKFSLDRESVHLFQIAIKGSKDAKGMVKVSIEGDKDQVTKEYEIYAEYKDYLIRFEKFYNTRETLTYTIVNNSNKDIYIDNFNIIKVGRGWDELKQENMEYANVVINSEKVYNISTRGEEERLFTKNSEYLYSMDKITNGEDNWKQQFYIIYNEAANAFEIVDKAKETALALTNKDEPKFYKNIQTARQLWYFKKVTDEEGAFQIISAADRGKALQWSDKKESANIISVQSLDVTNEKQYFKFPRII
ncbi:peptidase [Bacillus thuringiensis]|nr:peptidase [Bacillus thuringiensis]